MAGCFGCFAALILLVGFAVLGTVVTMVAWNVVIAGLFHGPEVNFWQAFAVNILLRLVRRTLTVNKE